MLCNVYVSKKKTWPTIMFPIAIIFLNLVLVTCTKALHLFLNNGRLNLFENAHSLLMTVRHIKIETTTPV